MSSPVSSTLAQEVSTTASPEARIITLNFRSYHPEEDEGIDYSESNEKEFCVFTVPNFLGARHSLIEWWAKPCGIELTPEAQDAITWFNEEEVENPWCAEINRFHGYIKCPAESLAKFRKYLTGIFECSDSWTSNGLKFSGRVIREKAVTQ